MIQTAARDVSMGMQPAATRDHLPPGIRQHAPVWGTARARRRDGRLSPAMPFEEAPDRDDWARLIVAVAGYQDRAAFASLFEYFAPRITTYMRRSGMPEARAEELAQETLLMVWRKAALFDPMGGSAAAWIFAIARNMRIDALRREHRGGVTETSEVEAEFQIDESPQPDIQLDAVQSESLVRSALAELSAERCASSSCPSSRRRPTGKSRASSRYRWGP
jgi:RNA polymerase sigma-70 factor, ECF subfamily